MKIGNSSDTRRLTLNPVSECAYACLNRPYQGYCILKDAPVYQLQDVGRSGAQKLGTGDLGTGPPATRLSSEYAHWWSLKCWFSLESSFLRRRLNMNLVKVSFLFHPVLCLHLNGFKHWFVTNFFVKFRFSCSSSFLYFSDKICLDNPLKILFLSNILG